MCSSHLFYNRAKVSLLANKSQWLPGSRRRMKPHPRRCKWWSRGSFPGNHLFVVANRLCYTRQRHGSTALKNGCQDGVLAVDAYTKMVEVLKCWPQYRTYLMSNVVVVGNAALYATATTPRLLLTNKLWNEALAVCRMEPWLQEHSIRTNRTVSLEYWSLRSRFERMNLDSSGRIFATTIFIWFTDNPEITFSHLITDRMASYFDDSSSCDLMDLQSRCEDLSIRTEEDPPCLGHIGQIIQGSRSLFGIRIDGQPPWATYVLLCTRCYTLGDPRTKTWGCWMSYKRAIGDSGIATNLWYTTVA